MAAVLEVTPDAFAALLGRKADELAHLDLTVPLRRIAVLARSSVLENFSGSHGPDGVPWLPLKHKRANSKGDDKPLRDKGILMASVTASGSAGHVEAITSRSLKLGTNVVYAAIQHFGGRIQYPEKRRSKPWVFKNAFGHTVFTQRIRAHAVTIPPRPFLGWGEGLLARSKQVLAEYLAEQCVP